MFERPKSGERAILVHIDFGQSALVGDFTEFQELARAAGAEIVLDNKGNRKAPDPRYFIGSGKADEIADLVASLKAEIVIFNHELSPAQERNLEHKFKCRVLSRTGLILDIFAQRARTFEGKLQVELAQLVHLSTRLVRGWTHLERQKGGIGLRGPGETQLESDRRLLRNRIDTIRGRLTKVRQQRAQSRKARQRQAMPTVALVGYTNAGKSTLFNSLTDADVLVANQLFATLDPTLRAMDLPTIGPVVLADTVGFVSHLPHDLVEAFKATLEEINDAVLLLHVVDVHDPNYQETVLEVNKVLAEVGAENVPQLLVLNKSDLLSSPVEPRIENDSSGQCSQVLISALTGAGMDLLEIGLAERLAKDQISGLLEIKAAQGKIRAGLYGLKAITEEVGLESGGWKVRISLPKIQWDRLVYQEPDLLAQFQPREV